VLSNASKYAINAVLYLSTHASVVNKLGAKEIALATKIPLPFLAKLLQTLAKRNVIASSKGPKGGFYLTEENQKQPLIKVVEHIDGLHKFNECVLGLSQCSSKNPCSIHFSVQPFRDRLLAEMSNNSIDSFAEKVKNGTAFLKLD
jgi:Rrf2 family protein